VAPLDEFKIWLHTDSRNHGVGRKGFSASPSGLDGKAAPLVDFEGRNLEGFYAPGPSGIVQDLGYHPGTVDQDPFSFRLHDIFSRCTKVALVLDADDVNLRGAKTLRSKSTIKGNTSATDDNHPIANAISVAEVHLPQEG
jgi:hypothetical protein